MDDFLHAQSTVKCAFNHPEKAPWFVCVAAGTNIPHINHYFITSPVRRGE